MNTEDKILQLLSVGKTQNEISDILKSQGIKPNSLSHIEKLLKKVRADHGATTMFHLGCILTKNNL